jgi:hypothetical protein
MLPQPLRHRLHLIGIVADLAKREAPLEIDERLLDRRLEVERIVRPRMKYPVPDHTCPAFLDMVSEANRCARSAAGEFHDVMSGIDGVNDREQAI